MLKNTSHALVSMILFSTVWVSARSWAESPADRSPTSHATNTSPAANASHATIAPSANNASPAGRVLIDGIVQTVNNEIILSSDLAHFQNRLQKTGMVDELLMGDLNLEVLKQSRKDQLEYLVNEKVLDSEVKRLNLSVTSERVEQEIREMAKRNKMTRQELTQALQTQGIPISEYQVVLKTRIERQNLLEQEITSKIRVTDEDVLAQYAKKQASPQNGFSEFTVAHIFFANKKGGKDRAEERAKSVLKKINAGQNFETLAEQHSEDPNFTTGGILGTFKTGEIAKEIEDAVAGLNPGQISGLVQSKNGVHILKLVSRKITSDPQFEKEKDRIRAAMMEQTFQKQFRIWLNQKKEESVVHFNPPK
ncbi:MAG: survival protein SurA [Bdellovibrio sp.]|nr:MAG: survival protein SurA [Bdellovibrio sp.]